MARPGRAHPVKIRSAKPWIFSEHTIANADIALGSGNATAPAIQLQSNADFATGSGLAPNPSVQLIVQAGMAVGTGEAPDATASTGPTLVATAGIALGGGGAQGAMSAPRLTALGTGLALPPDLIVIPRTSLITASGQAPNPGAQLSPTIPFIVGSGSTLTAKAQITQSLALISATGNAPAPNTVLTPQLSTGTGSGVSPTPNIEITGVSGLASGSGAANNPSVSLTENPLGRFLTDIQSAGSTALNVFAVGDSITEGLNGSGDGGDKITDRWLYRWAALARTRYSLSAGGVGYIKLIDNVSNASHAAGYFTFNTSGWTFDGADGQAFGHQSGLLAVNETIRLDWVGTSFKLQYALGQSVFTVAIDGGGSHTVTPSAGSTYRGWWHSKDDGGVTLSSGSHYAIITPTSGQRLKILGAFLYSGDETNGIHVWDNSQSGIGASAATAFGGYESGFVPNDQLATGGCVDPSLVFVSLGMNDFASATATASFITAMETIIGLFDPLRGSPLVTRWPAIVMIAPHQYASDLYTANPSWIQYQTAYNTILAAFSTRVTFIDMSTLMAAPTAANSYSSAKVNSDEVHLRTLGNQFWASQIDSVVH